MTRSTQHFFYKRHFFFSGPNRNFLCSYADYRYRLLMVRTFSATSILNPLYSNSVILLYQQRINIIRDIAYKNQERSAVLFFCQCPQRRYHKERETSDVVYVVHGHSLSVIVQVSATSYEGIRWHFLSYQTVRQQTVLGKRLCTPYTDPFIKPPSPADL